MKRDSSKVYNVSDYRKKGGSVSIDGERTELNTFILCGEDTNGKRVMLTYNTSIDDMTTLLKTLDVMISERISATMKIEE
ncbi:DUF3931 domain-containing protein [Bacillus sp. CGMCC 1.16541]|uniref:DUF3931 domain-containing protein n=1 Tax=Bacillus sp. CGMCC 1.16541 TaxID=2185143 RepID=UPI0013A5A19D|nr:DUF3931 domain-containing protein [Bacillus sp. CGMCC 1.16541]